MPKLKTRTVIPVFARNDDKPKGIRVRAQSDSEYEIFLYGELGFAFSSASFAEAINEIPEETETINIYIHSPGGFVDEGYAILSAIGRLKDEYTVHTHVDGWAYSMASAIAVAGDRVFMSSTSKLMIHNPFMHLDILGTHTVEDITQLQEWLEERKEDLDKDTEILASLYAKRVADMSPEEFREQYLAGGNHYFTPDEAQELGLIDEINDPISIDEESAAAFSDQSTENNINIESINGKPRVAAFGGKRDAGKTRKGVDPDKTGGQKPKAGETLAALINDAIEAEVDFSDDLERSDIIDSMAEAADLSAEAVRSILREETNCPQQTSFEGFSEVIDLDVDQMIQAAQQDGCEYEGEGSEARLISCGGWFPTETYDESEFAKRGKSNYNNGKKSSKTSNAMPDIIRTLNKATEREENRLPEDATQAQIETRVQNIIDQRDQLKSQLNDIKEETRENRAKAVVDEVVSEVEDENKGKEVNRKVVDEKLTALAKKVVDADDEEYENIIKESMKDKATLNLVPIGKDEGLSGGASRSDASQNEGETLNEDELKKEKQKGEQMREEREKRVNK